VEVHPFRFEDPVALARSMEGAEALYNTYWVRFNYGSFNHAQAVENTRRLFAAAAQAGVQRIVHVSITNPSEDSHLPYFRGKAVLEKALRQSGLSHAILRPAVLFGGQDILINNIAWGLRRFPLFPIFGDGRYRLQPIHVDDLASLAVEHGRSRDNVVIDAIGPETYEYRDLVRMLGAAIGCEKRIVSVSPRLGYAMGKMIGWWQKDVFITREEIEGLMAGLLCTNSRPTARTRLSEWAVEHAGELGREYRSELARRRR
jgi:NADH dehydrogenase